MSAHGLCVAARRSIIKQCWDPKPASRLSFLKILVRLPTADDLLRLPHAVPQ